MFKDCVETAFCFFHQKLQVYSGMVSDGQADDIEQAIATYVNGMNGDLYSLLAAERKGFLLEHATFQSDLIDAVRQLENML